MICPASPCKVKNPQSAVSRVAYRCQLSINFRGNAEAQLSSYRGAGHIGLVPTVGWPRTSGAHLQLVLRRERVAALDAAGHRSSTKGPFGKGTLTSALCKGTFTFVRNLVRVLRTKELLSQAQLGEALGVSRQTIIAIERGRYLPSLPLAINMARFFSLAVEDLFLLDEKEAS